MRFELNSFSSLQFFNLVYSWPFSCPRFRIILVVLLKWFLLFFQHSDNIRAKNNIKAQNLRSLGLNLTGNEIFQPRFWELLRKVN